MTPRDPPVPLPDPLLAAVLAADPAVRDQPAVAGCLDLWRAGDATLPDAVFRALRELIHINHMRALIIARAAAGARGIVCPDCHVKMGVRRTTLAPGGRPGRRYCPKCGYTSPTTERPSRHLRRRAGEAGASRAG